jgi:hypothetical protein
VGVQLLNRGATAGAAAADPPSLRALTGVPARGTAVSRDAVRGAGTRGTRAGRPPLR